MDVSAKKDFLAVVKFFIGCSLVIRLVPPQHACRRRPRLILHFLENACYAATSAGEFAASRPASMSHESTQQALAKLEQVAAEFVLSCSSNASDLDATTRSCGSMLKRMAASHAPQLGPLRAAALCAAVVLIGLAARVLWWHVERRATSLRNGCQCLPRQHKKAAHHHHRQQRMRNFREREPQVCKIHKTRTQTEPVCDGADADQDTTENAPLFGRQISPDQALLILAVMKRIYRVQAPLYPGHDQRLQRAKAAGWDPSVVPRCLSAA